MVINTQQILIYGTHKYLLQEGTRGILSLNRASNWNLRWDVTKSETINNENRKIELLSLSDKPINTQARTVEKKLRLRSYFNEASANLLLLQQWNWAASNRFYLTICTPQAVILLLQIVSLCEPTIVISRPKTKSAKQKKNLITISRMCKCYFVCQNIR